MIKPASRGIAEEWAKLDGCAVPTFSGSPGSSALVPFIEICGTVSAARPGIVNNFRGRS
jgi:hypothetical protein